ncbi:hypothetical protein B7463_g5803, partial [Scytalidium lignicola]
MFGLSAEIQSYIWEYTGLIAPSVVFISVASETAELVQFFKSPHEQELDLQPGACVSIDLIRVFEADYIREISLQSGSKTEGNIIGNVTALKFAASIGGICSIKLFGADWESDWLGGARNERGVFRYGIIYIKSSKLRICYNGLNCIEISDLKQSSAKSVLWDREDFPSLITDPDRSLIDFGQDIAGLSRPVIGTAKPQLFASLPLCTKAGYITALTVYHSGTGILRIIRNPIVAFVTPALMIQTTMGRVFTFGSFINPQLVKNNRYMWILLEGKGNITAMFYEIPLYQAIVRLGVVRGQSFSDDTILMPRYHNVSFPKFAGPDAGLFLSVAHLGGLERAEICQMAGRCTGLLLHFSGRPSAVLGQWYSNSVAKRSCIYNGQTDVTDIYFYTKKFKNYSIVVNIGFLRDSSVEEADCYVFPIGAHIAWWFSKGYDAVCLWDGELIDIPAQSKESYK